MTIALTYHELITLGPCDRGLERASLLLGNVRTWGHRPVTAAEARARGCTMDDLVWVASKLSRTNQDIQRRLRLWTADCAAHVLPIYEKSETSPAPRNAIVAARRFARGEIDAAELAAEWDAARAAEEAAEGAAAGYAAWAAVVVTIRAAIRVVASAAARAAVKAAAWDAWAAEEQWQYDRLVLWLSDVEPEDWPLPQLNKETNPTHG